MLASLCRESGQPLPTLLAAIADALEELQEQRERTRHAHGETNGHEAEAPAPQDASQPIWEVAEELFGAIPDEELAQLPTDGAAQHDHYIYGTPKRPT